MTMSSQKPVIALVAFGTSVAKARVAYEQVEQAVRTAYPDHDIRWAYTAKFIRRKLAQSGLVVPSPEELAKKLAEEGVTKAVFQSLHVVPGQEYEELADIDTHGVDISFGRPLIACDDDIEALLDALSDEISRPEPLVLAAHGNDRYPVFNEWLEKLDKALKKRRETAWVCTVEGSPGTTALQEAKYAANKAKSVRFVPAMIVAGDHIMNDVMGEDDDSWKLIVGAQNTDCGAPLGTRPSVHNRFIAHLANAYASL